VESKGEAASKGTIPVDATHGDGVCRRGVSCNGEILRHNLAGSGQSIIEIMGIKKDL